MSRKGTSGMLKNELNKAGVTAAQDRTIDKLVKRTRDLKKEQLRLVDENGNVVLEKKGSSHEVATTVGEKRDYMPGAVSIHNHPDGGTFSDADLSDFGYGARQMVIAAPEGTYKLTNTKYGTKDQSRGWYDMREALVASGVTRDRSFTELRKAAQDRPEVKKALQAISRTSDQWVKAKQAGKPQAELDKIYARSEKQSAKYKTLLAAAERKLTTQPYHDFFRRNASKYGFKYEFIKK